MKNTIFLTLLTLLFLGMVAYALPTETFVSPTQDNNSFYTLDWFYVNITSDENLNKSYLEIGNATGGFTNFTMTNSSLTNWYLNTTGQSGGQYNYTMWMQNTSGDWDQSTRRYYYYVTTDNHILLGEDYTLGRIFDSSNNIIFTSVPIQINDTEISADTYNHTINTTQDWTSLNINFTPMTIGTGHNAYLYIEGSGEIKYIDDSEYCESVGTNEIKCITTGINVDSTGTNKFVSYQDDISLSTPIDNYINASTKDTQAFVFTMTNTYASTLPCSLYMDDTIVYTDSTVDDSTETTFYSNTSLTNSTHEWYIECGGHDSSVRTLVIDNAPPTIDNYGVENVSTGVLNLDYTVRENDTGSTCTFYIYNDDTTDTVTGIWNQSTGEYRDCEYNLTANDITNDGYFVVGVVIEDTMGNSLTGTNQTNFTSVKMYAGWTALQMDRNMTMKNFSAMNDGITRLSIYDNTDKAFTTYTVGLSTNADIVLNDSDFVFAQVSTDTSLLRQLTWDYGAERNITLTKGWNQMSAWNYTSYLNLEEACDEPIDNSSIAITHVAWWESLYQRYVSHTCGFASNNETEVPLGQGYFTRTNGTTTMGRYR